MKLMWLAYMQEKKWEAMSKNEQDACIKDCLAYDDMLRRKGHLTRAEALQSISGAKTLRWQNGKVSVTDGPFAETKEQLGGILMLDARDMDHAIQLLSKHPGIRLPGCFELRPVEEQDNLS